ncbi:MAG: hypothetical protein SGPRY_013291, partial [Prymnesium sp.]
TSRLQKCPGASNSPSVRPLRLPASSCLAPTPSPPPWRSTSVVFPAAQLRGACSTIWRNTLVLFCVGLAAS